MNKIILTGRICKDIDLRMIQTSKGTYNVVRFTLAVEDTSKKNQDGHYQSDFIECEVWGIQAENLKKYQSKGDLIGVIGKLKSNNYTDKQGNKKYGFKVMCENIEYLRKANNNQVQSTPVEEPKAVEEDLYQSFADEYPINPADLPF